MNLAAVIVMRYNDLKIIDFRGFTTIYLRDLEFRLYTRKNKEINSIYIFKRLNNIFPFVMFSSNINAIQITLQIQSPSTPPSTPISPRDAQSPDGLASVSSGSSDANSGEFFFCIIIILFIGCDLDPYIKTLNRMHYIKV